MKFLEKLERKHPRWGVENLMLHISILNIVVFVFSLIRPAFVSMLYMNSTLVLKGQIWRLISFIAIPPTFSVLFFILVVYFYYFLGTTLEQQWGTFRFTAFYIITALGTILASFITGGSYGGYYLNLSVFLAFAYLFPNHEFLLFFIIPVKVKYLAFVDIAFLALSLAFAIFAHSWADVGAIIASLSGLVVFFSGDIVNRVKAYYRRKKYMKRIK